MITYICVAYKFIRNWTLRDACVLFVTIIGFVDNNRERWEEDEAKKKKQTNWKKTNAYFEWICNVHQQTLFVECMKWVKNISIFSVGSWFSMVDHRPNSMCLLHYYSDSVYFVVWTMFENYCYLFEWRYFVVCNNLVASTPKHNNQQSESGSITMPSFFE